MISAAYWGIAWLAPLAFVIGGDWPQFLGPHRNGTAPGESIDQNLSSAPILWRKPLGAGYSGPVVVEDQLFVFHSGRGQEILECFSKADGRSLWQAGYACTYQGGYGTGPGPRATPCVAHGVIFNFGARATLQAVDLSGKVLWRRDLAKEHGVPEGYFGVGTSPVVEGENLLVTLGAPKASLVAFDTKTGETRWSTTNEEASYASPTVADLRGERLALFFARTGLHIVDPRDGAERAFFRWRARMDASVNAATPLVIEDSIFLSAQYGTGAVLLNWNGRELLPSWKSDESLVCHYDTPVYHKGHLFGIDGRQEWGAHLKCVKLDTGQPTWTEEGFGCAAIILVQEKLLCWTEKGEVILVDADPAAFHLRGKLKIGGTETRAHPALSDGILFVRSEDELVAVDLRPHQQGDGQ